IDFISKNILKFNMVIEQDPYSLIKYINVINTNNDGYGYPTIHAFVEMGLLTMNEKFLCEINGTLYECYIDKNEKDRYVLCYQDKIKETNVMKFIHKLSKLIHIRIQSMGLPFQRIHRKCLYSEFGIWKIETDYDVEKKKIKFICKSNMTNDARLQILNSTNNMSYNDVDDDIFKEKQQVYSLIKYDAIEINYQPMTDDDILKLDKGDNNTSYSPEMYKDEGNISCFVKEDINKLVCFSLLHTNI
ncbi:unnamed protein product, partial [Rotaria sp. Silwood2]